MSSSKWILDDIDNMFTLSLASFNSNENNAWGYLCIMVNLKWINVKRSKARSKTIDKLQVVFFLVLPFINFKDNVNEIKSTALCCVYSLYEQTAHPSPILAYRCHCIITCIAFSFQTSAYYFKMILPVLLPLSRYLSSKYNFIWLKMANKVCNLKQAEEPNSVFGIDFKFYLL